MKKHIIAIVLFMFTTNVFITNSMEQISPAIDIPIELLGEIVRFGINNEIQGSDNLQQAINNVFRYLHKISLINKQFNRLFSGDNFNIYIRLPLIEELKMSNFSKYKHLLNALLEETIKKNHKFAADILIEVGADINYSPIGGWQTTPLMEATRLNRKDLVELLIQKGVLLNKTDLFNNTALHYAALQKDSLIFDILIKAGADITIRDSRGQSVSEFKKTLEKLQL